MPLYTFIMDYAGGTYLQQIRAATPAAACLEFANALNTSAAGAINEEAKRELIEQVGRDVPVLVDGLVSTWCSTAIVKDNVALIHFVRTEK